MTLHNLKRLVAQNPEKEIQLQLPNGALVPPAFHVTEVASVRKSLVDCGGRMHTDEVCQLQAWSGTDDEHRIAGAKLFKILDKGASLLSHDDVPVEFEYEAGLLSQYPIEGWEIDGKRLVLNLGHKHTDCRAKDVCSPGTAPTPCCGGTCACAA